MRPSKQRAVLGGETPGDKCRDVRGGGFGEADGAIELFELLRSGSELRRPKGGEGAIELKQLRIQVIRTAERFLELA